jgi:hypothetical protein
MKSVSTSCRTGGACPILDTGASRRRPDEGGELPQKLGPGLHREPWIPAGVYPVLDTGPE